MFSNNIGHARGMAIAVVSLIALTGCPSPNPHGDPDAGSLAQTLYVAHDGVLVSYDLATGSERPGTITNVTSPTDMQALENGTLLVNLTNLNQVLAFDGRTMLESSRLPASAMGATRPVHSYLSPERNGKRYWLALNDGQSGDTATNSARFVGIVPGDAHYLQAVGEVGVGIGHHKAAFSSTVERVVISNIADCNTVLGVYDYSDIAHVQPVKTWSAAELGWDNSSFGKTCDPTYQHGVPPAPHGCATSKVSGKAYCNLTSSGDLVAVALDATPPAMALLHTHGSGGGYTKASRDGRYIYSLQDGPREGAGGVTCQVGQLVTVDASTDTVVSELPLLYKGPGCTSAITGTDEESTEPSHILPSHDGKTLYLATAGGFGITTARVRQELVVDVSDPTHPVQKASIQIGASTSYHGDALSGDGKWLFLVNNKDDTVSQIDTATNLVTRTLTVRSAPQVVATFGSAEGPSEQTGPIE